jgi:hypothetical protein
MNASDIVKNKQNQALYQAYYQPRVFQSTVFSTLTPISSYTGGYNSYGSTVNTVYTYSSQPTFLSYELLNEVKAGKDQCTATCTSELTWSNLTSTTTKFYNTNYSTLSTPLNIGVTSTIVQGSTGPVICPRVNFYQGTNADSSYPTWNEPTWRY